MFLEAGVYKSSPKVIWKECVATPHSSECSCPLHVPLVVQSLLQIQMSSVSQLWLRYIHTTVPHSSYKLHYAV